MVVDGEELDDDDGICEEDELGSETEVVRGTKAGSELPLIGLDDTTAIAVSL